MTILISDVNDNHPTFASPFYLAGVTEGARILSPVITVTATDKDILMNSRIKYSIVGGDSNGKRHFVITQSINQSINQSTNESVNQSINQSTNLSVNQSINQPINLLTNQYLKHLIIIKDKGNHKHVEL